MAENKAKKKPEKRPATKKAFYRGIGDKLEIWAFDRKNQWALLHSIEMTPALGDKFRLPLIVETRYKKKHNQ